MATGVPAVSRPRFTTSAAPNGPPYIQLNGRMDCPDDVRFKDLRGNRGFSFPHLGC
jgi:hypothetical protein